MGDRGEQRTKRRQGFKQKFLPALICLGAVAATSLAMAGMTLSAVPAATNPLKLPLGDGQYSTAKAERGSIYLCHANPGGGGAQVNGPWIKSDGTWDSTAKTTVDGSVKWPSAFARFKIRGRYRYVASNSLPTRHTTGTFPIAPTDDAYQYDRNPSGITAQTSRYVLRAKPRKGKPQCIGGEVGIARNGVHIYDGLDALLRDAPAHELQDHCDGHPNQQGYHYHQIPPCLYAGQSKRRLSGLVGFAYDGFPLYGPRGAGGKMLDNDDLDVCHGRTSRVWLDGRWQKTYHYVATLEYPYTVGCFRGTVIAAGVPR